MQAEVAGNTDINKQPRALRNPVAKRKAENADAAPDHVMRQRDAFRLPRRTGREHDARDVGSVIVLDRLRRLAIGAYPLGVDLDCPDVADEGAAAVRCAVRPISAGICGYAAGQRDNADACQTEREHQVQNGIVGENCDRVAALEFCGAVRGTPHLRSSRRGVHS